MKKLALLSAVAVSSAALLGGASAFAATDLNEATQSETPVTATFTLPDGGGTNPTPPGGEDGDNDNNELPSEWGIAYQPKSFNFPETKLKESGHQTIEATKTSSFNVGVKDKTRGTKGWTLKASLAWTGDAIEGAKITTTASGDVKVNTNTGGEFNPSDLQPTDKVTGESNLEINSIENVVMTGKPGERHNDVYDYDLGNVTLDIADAGKVEGKSYNGKVVWNLTATPE